MVPDPVDKTKKYPDSLQSVLHQNRFENIVDSNIFSAFIPENLPIPKVKDPRKTNAPRSGTLRHPGYVHSDFINQTFSYIGYIKRVKNEEFKRHLPVLFSSLNRFIRILVDIIFIPDIIITEDIYAEQQAGLKNFMNMFHRREHRNEEWIESIWNHQKHYLENIDRVLQSLKRRGKVFEFKNDSFHRTIVSSCRFYFQEHHVEVPGDTDLDFVANCCLKAVHDGRPKTIWSGDRHIKSILSAFFSQPHLSRDIPQIYQRANYFPLNYRQLFPEPSSHLPQFDISRTQ